MIKKQNISPTDELKFENLLFCIINECAVITYNMQIDKSKIQARQTIFSSHVSVFSLARRLKLENELKCVRVSTKKLIEKVCLMKLFVKLHNIWR